MWYYSAANTRSAGADKDGALEPSSAQRIPIIHYSDVLCVWAYIAQIRVDELLESFGDQVEIDYRFCAVFGDAHGKIERGWRKRGGFAGYGEHVKNTAARFPHVQVHGDIWTRNIPRSSLSCHLFLTAIKLAEEEGALAGETRPFARAIWAFRRAFFRDLIDVADRERQRDIASALSLPVDAVDAHLASGAAHARLSADQEAAKTFQVGVSPTMLFDGGRQRLIGNVGYRVIEANLRELLRDRSEESFSWC